ncbi:Inositol-pentakisphosphate 2-kinase [Elasticomyces elasticus]|nr:Inositol-pentakisphosphate 2-kinase [Elasticomyces elasticus]
MSFPLPLPSPSPSPSPSPPTPPSAGLLLELKPKWLAQSPNAPRTSSRCRTCALRALRRARRLPGGSNGGGDFCPLVLALGDAEALRGVLEGVLGPVGEGGREGRERMMEALVRFFTAGGGRRLVGVLRDLQIGLDPDGVLALAESEKPGPGLLRAMTLRDCTLFVRVTAAARVGSEGGHEVEARLADLDMKHGGRVGKWRKTERELVEGGWYTNSTTGDERGVGRSGTQICWLSRRR